MLLITFNNLVKPFEYLNNKIRNQNDRWVKVI